MSGQQKEPSPEKSKPEDVSIIVESSEEFSPADLRRGELEAISMQLEKERRRLYHVIFKLLTWVGFITFVAVLLIRVWHLVTPESLQWLGTEHIQEIDKIIFSGAIGGFVGSNFKKFSKTD